MSSVKNPAGSPFPRSGGKVRLRNFYRVYLGKGQRQQIWIVDGAKVVRELYPAFVMGGNDQRYRFNPPGDIWIDDRMAIEELEYTIAHELIERKLMRERGWSYDRAHIEGGLALEKRLRPRDALRAARKERDMEPVAVGEWEAELPPDKAELRVKLQGIYRSYFGKYCGLAVWIVDGPKVRTFLDPDFCFAGHGLKYRFVPRDEIWLDSTMAVGEATFALWHEVTERMLMAAGEAYDDAYEHALSAMLSERAQQTRFAREHEAALPPVSYGVRERGARVRRKKRV